MDEKTRCKYTHKKKDLKRSCILFSVEASKLFIDPDGGERKESCNQRKDTIFIIPLKYFSDGRQK